LPVTHTCLIYKLHHRPLPHSWLPANVAAPPQCNTDTLVLALAHLLSPCSPYFFLEPGDVIITGTPPGVGLGMKPTPQFLKEGDVVRLGIDKLGYDPVQITIHLLTYIQIKKITQLILLGTNVLS